MVLLSRFSKGEITRITKQLINWKVNGYYVLTVEHALKYMEWLVSSIEAKTTLDYYEKVDSTKTPYRFCIRRRQTGTYWYAYFDIDQEGDIIVKRIVNGYSLANNKVKIHGFEYFS